MGVVPRPRPEHPLLVNPRPRLARIIRAKEAALVRLNHRPDALRIGRRDRHADLADELRQSVRHFLPRIAAVGRFVDTAALAAANYLPRQPLMLPECRVENARVARIHAQIARTAFFIDVQHQFPRRAAVGGAVDAAFGGGRPHVALRRHIHYVRVFRMDLDARDLPRPRQPQVRPRLACVGRFVDAVAVRSRHTAYRCLAHADVDHIRIRHGHLDSPDRSGLEETVRDVFPRHAAVFGLPHAAAGRAHVVGQHVTRHARDGHRAPTPVRPHVAPLHPRHQRRIDGIVRFFFLRQRQIRHQQTNDKNEHSDEACAARKASSGVHGSRSDEWLINAIRGE